MKEPQKPNEDDCCGSGCNPCIFDVYEKQMKLYSNYLQNNINLTETNAIDKLELTKFTLVTKMYMNDDHAILKFKHIQRSNVNWQSGDHFIVNINHNNGKYSRSYTPLRLSCKPYEFALLVKKYQNGIVSKYLFSLNIGDVTDWRGPYGTYKYCPNKYERIIMIAQGTGVALFHGIVTEILENIDDYTKNILFYCAKELGSVFLREELHDFSSNWNFTYKIFLANEAQEGSIKYKEPILNRKLDTKDFNCLEPFSDKDQFMICGSETFMTSYKTFLLNINVTAENIKLF